MLENIPILLKAYETATGTLTAFTGWKSRSRGDTRILIEEIKHNSRHLWLAIEGEVDTGTVIAQLKVAEYQRLMRSGFDFNRLERKKIGRDKSLAGTDLASWQGKTTEALLINIYDKINNLQTDHTLAPSSKKIRWQQRINNIQRRILLLIRHADSSQ